ncbi:MAG: hypothetical protein SNJ49_01770 [Chloracidobacterium sp.]
MTTGGFQRLFQQPEWCFGSLGAAGAGWLWFVLTRHGIGLSPDSVGYLAVSQHLVEGHGLVSYQGDPFVVQPPLYPLCIAGLGYLSNLSLPSSALALNVALFGLIILLSGKLTFLATGSLKFSIFICFSIIFGIPIFWISLFAWSELLFILFLLCNFTEFHKLISKNKNVYIFSCLVFANLAFLTRYVGFLLIVSNLLILFILFIKKGKNFFVLLYFAVLSISIPSIFVLRNYAVSGTFFGPRTLSSIRISENLLLFSDAFFSWVIAPLGNLIVTPILIVGAIILIFVLLINYLFHTLRLQELAVSNLILFIIVYLSFILLSSTRIAYDPIDNRLLSPIFIPLSIVLVHFFSKTIYPNLRAKLPERTERLAVTAGVLIWFTYPVVSTVTLAIEVWQDGKGYHSLRWQTSETLAYVRKTHKQLTQLPIYTNDPEGMYFLAQTRAAHLPFRVRASWPEPGCAYVVRFKHAYRGECLELLEQLRSVADIVTHKQFSDGEIYIVTRKAS